MNASTGRLIEAIHQSPAKGVVAVTGGGAGAVSDLLCVPGASRTILEAIVPYHENALVEFLAHRPESFCSEDTGRQMALRAFERACWLAPGESVFGLGCTASLATDRPKKGAHRFHRGSGRRIDSMPLLWCSRRGRDRAAEEAVLDALLLNLLAETAGVESRLDVPLLDDEHRSGIRGSCRPFVGSSAGTISCLCVDAMVACADAPPPAVLLPGSFNPAHAGHFGLAMAASRLTGVPAGFELSVVNVDKPPLGAAEVRRRMQQFLGQFPLWLTRAPTFVEKARLFPRAAFVVGLDTAERILAPRYYQESEARMLEALAEMGTSGCRFLVAGRAEQEKFRTLADLALPEVCRALFMPIPESDFRLDVSSTSLRQQDNS